MKEENKKPRLKPWMKFLIFLGLAFLFALFGHYYSNPYPCSISGVGCHDVGQLMRDTWVSTVSVLGITLSIVTAMFFLVNHNPFSDEKVD